MKKYTLMFCFLLIVFTACEKEVSVTTPLGEPENGYVFVKSTPAGSKIFLNGKNTGKVTPDSLYAIEFGSALVTLRGNYFKDTSLTVVFTKDIKNRLDVDFTTNPGMRGSITCTTKPAGALIFINDSSTGIFTPHKFLDVLPGNYKINYQLKGYRCPSYNSIVSSGVIASSYSVLQDTTVWVDYLVTNSGIPTNSLSCVEADNAGNIWIGSANKGLIYFDKTNWINYSRENSLLPSNAVTAVAKGYNGDIFVGTTNGLVKISSGVWEVFNSDNSALSNDYINCIKKDNIGNIWIGTKGGLFKYNSTGFTIYTGSNSNLPESHITSLAATTLGVLYVGTYQNGVVEINGSVFTRYSISYNYPGLNITAAEVDKNNNIWFGHMPASPFVGGISVFNGSTFTSYTAGLPVNSVNNIFVDDNDRKWVSTNDGLAGFGDYSLINVYRTQNSGLKSNFIRGVTQDKNGSLWIVTSDGGLCKFKY